MPSTNEFQSLFTDTEISFIFKQMKLRDPAQILNVLPRCTIYERFLKIQRKYDSTLSDWRSLASFKYLCCLSLTIARFSRFAGCLLTIIFLILVEDCGSGMYFGCFEYPTATVAEVVTCSPIRAIQFDATFHKCRNYLYCKLTNLHIVAEVSKLFVSIDRCTVEVGLHRSTENATIESYIL